MTRDHLKTLVPPVLADALPAIGPTLAERRANLYRVLRMAPGLSDRNIATWCGVSRALVTKTRGQLVAAGTISRREIRLGGDGKRYRIAAKETSS